jgi:excisionase family DNA binding protein
MVTPAERDALFDLLHQDHYTPEELARLLGVDPHLIHQDAQTGRLRAYIVDHHVLDIRREDVLAWLEKRASR